MGDEEPQISYSVKEVLDRIDGKLDGVIASLAGKADHASVVRLDEKVDKLDNRLKTAEAALADASKQKQAKIDWHRWLIPTVLSAVGTLAMILAVWHP